MKKTLAAILLSSALAILPLSSQADEALAKMQIETIATGLVPNLPSGKKVVLKTISPEDSGLPADFLRKLTSDLEAALLVASEFEINLVNRQTTEEIWAEAMEFNNADFDALHAASGANVALMLSARATEAGVEITLTAYSLDTADAGKVLASSGSTVLALDMQVNVGVDVNSLNDQMAQVLAEIEKVGQTGGLISDPNTYAEYYHNARMFQQRGEIDIAIANYEETMKFDLQFADPVLDLIKLVRARYSGSASKQFFQKRVLPYANEDIKQLIYVAALATDDGEIVEEINSSNITFPPALAYWLRENGKKMKAYRDGNVSHQIKLPVDSALLKAAREVKASLENQQFSTFFIDNLVSVDFAEVSEINALIQEMNRAYVQKVDIAHVYQSSNQVLLTPLICSFFSPRFVFDTKGNPTSGNLQSVNEVEAVNLDDMAELVKIRAEVCSRDETQYNKEGLLIGTNGFNYLKKDAYEITLGGKMIDKISYAGLLDKTRYYEGEGLPCMINGLSEVRVNPPKTEVGFPFESPKFNKYIAEFGFGGSELTSHQYGELGDYALYGDACIERYAEDMNSSVKSGDTFKLPFLAGLTITDSVDEAKPILLYYEDFWGDIPVAPSDITKDGTYISPFGPTVGGGNAEWGFEYRRMQADWLFVPGLLQSSVLRPTLTKIVYFNNAGEEIELTNIEFLQQGNHSILPEISYYIKGHFWASETPMIEDQIKLYANNMSADMSLEELVRIINVAQNELTYNDRIQIQTNLSSLGIYQGTIDGVWGRDSEDAVKAYFKYIDSYDPTRSYFYVWEFTDGITGIELLEFFDVNTTCNLGSKLRDTAACN